MSQKTADFAKNPKKREENEIWYCREYWAGDSRDGLYCNGDGYHYFKMKGDGFVEKAYEYYEDENGEENVNIIPELVGIHWFQFFGFSEDEELLEEVGEQEFLYIEQFLKKRC